MRVLAFPILAALLLAPGIAQADRNEQPSCPFPSSPGAGHSRTYEPGDDYSDANPESDSQDVGEPPCTGSLDASSSSGSGHGGGIDLDGLEWPEALGARVGGSFGNLDWGDADFVDAAGTVSVAGSVLRLGSVDLAGGELVVDVALTDVLRIGGGVGLYGPVGGEAGGSLVPGRFGRDAISSDLSVFTAFVEAGFVQRVGLLTAFAALHAGLMSASLSIESDCGCNGELSANRFVLGPRLGLRLPLHRSLFLQGAVFADLRQLPDYVATVGLGFGRRAL